MIPTKVYGLIGELIPMIVLFLIMTFLLKIVSIKFSNYRGSIWIEFKAVIYIIYAFVLFHLVTTTDFQSYSNNFTPFKEIMRYKITDGLFMRNVIGNIAVFIPFGYIVTDCIKMLAKKTYFFISILYCILTSLSIEFIQFFIGRAFDIDDIILNFIGGLLGYILYKLVHITVKEK